MAYEGYDPEVENKDLNSSSSKSSPFSDSTSGTGASFSRGDQLDPVRRAERRGFWQPHGDNAGSSERGATDKAGRGEGGAASQTGRANASGLEKEETAGGYASGFNEGNTSSTSRRRAVFTRRRAIFAGVGTATATGIIIGFLSLGTGPFEFIHLAQLMEKFHFSSQQNAENSRLEKIVRYLNDPERPERTRMGIVGNAIADKLEAKIHDATGLSVDYENGQFKGYIADTKHVNFEGKTPEEMRTTMADQLGVDASSIDIVTSKDGVKVPRYNPSTSRFNSVRNYFNQTSTARGLFTEAGFNDISAYMSARVLKTRAGWTFHPIKALDSQYQAKLLEGGKKALDKLKEQFNSEEEVAINTDTTPPPATSENPNEQNANNQPVNDPNRQAAANAGQNIQGDATDSNIKAKIAGGGAALVGIACVMHGIDQSVPQLREAKVLMPMVKLAGQFVSLGSQVQSGQDITSTQVGLYKQFLDGTNSNGKVTSTWDQARSIQAELGEPQTGPDLPKNAQVFNAGVPFGFIEFPGLGTICDILGSPIGIIGSAIISPVSTIFQTVAVGPVLSDAVSSLANWLTGVPINIFKGAGATDGNYINYGSRLSANEQFASAGGVQLSSKQELAIKDTTSALDNAQFKSKSIAYRVLNPYDYRTLASKVIDNYSSTNLAQGFASLFSGIASAFTNVFKVTASLIYGLGNASAAQPYDYHELKAVGFTADDLGSQEYDNPFANACTVTGGQGCPNATGILGDPNSPNQSFIDRALTCFGDTISPDGGNWDISFNSNNQPIDTDSDSYKSANCADTDPNWTRVRFWIMDTQTIEGYDCYNGSPGTSDQSCQDMGFDSSSSSGSSGSQTTSGSIDGFVNPLSKIQNLSPGRVDQGVDYSGSGPILAMGAGTVLNTTNAGWPGGTMIVVRLDSMPDKFYYVAENCQNIQVRDGQHVNAGDTLCTLINAFPNLETGWADGSHIPNALAHDAWVGNDSVSNYTAEGKNFSDLLVKLGAPAGTIQPGARELGSLPAGWPTWK